VCDPGPHIFSSRFVNRVSVIEADLQPGQTYDLEARFYLVMMPVKRDQKERELVAQWMKEAFWVTRGAEAAVYEAMRREATATMIRDFTIGDKKNRLLHLAPEDHR
jgi:hypothetical protein